VKVCPHFCQIFGRFRVKLSARARCTFLSPATGRWHYFHGRLFVLPPGTVHSQSKSSFPRTPVVGRVAKHLVQNRARNYHVPRRLQSRKSGKDAVLPSPRTVLAGSVHMTLFCISCSKQTRQFSPHKYHAQLCTIMHGHPCCFDCKKYARDGRRSTLWLSHSCIKFT